MSDFISMFVEMLPQHSNLQKADNPFRVVLDRTVGEYMDNISTETVFDGLFLMSATGGWLDAHGADYGVARRLDEDDESYRNRIVFEKLEYLNASNLINIFGLVLYAFVSNYNPSNNTLTSDNPYTSSKYMSVADSELQSILDKKFVLDDEIVWLEVD